jgi:putative transposase
MRYIIDASIYHWKKRFGGMDVTDARQLKDLEMENTRLKRIVADQALDIVMLKDVNSKKW